LTLILQGVLSLGLLLFIWRRNWESMFLTTMVIGFTLLPTFFGRHYRVFIPPEFQLIAAVFVFLSFFLGSATDFYNRFWWWDIALHTSSGFLLGIVGFMAVFVLNQTDRIPKGIKPAFLCFFAVTFAVTLGVLWEIVEFIVDRFTETDMQGRETGVVDTMQDLIVDTLGAMVVAVRAWYYQSKGRYSFIADIVKSFVQRNPRLFKRGRIGPS